MNYLSRARTWVLLLGGTSIGFDSYQVILVKRGVQRISRHVTQRAPPLAPEELKVALHHITTAGPHTAVLTAALLIGYHTLLRHCNLLSSHTHTDPGHTLQRSDITLTNQGLKCHNTLHKNTLAARTGLHTPGPPQSRPAADTSVSSALPMTAQHS